MAKFLKSLIYWSPQITGTCIIAYNLAPPNIIGEIEGFSNATLNIYRLSLFSTFSPADLASICALNGGIYARMAHKLSSFGHYLPEQWSKPLQAIQYTQETIPYDKIRPLLKKALPLKDTFKQIYKQPLHVGLISQIYKGELSETYQNVIIKIKIPAREAQYRWDSFYLSLIAKWVLRKSPKFQEFYQIYTSLMDSVSKEANYEQECKQALEYRQLLLKNQSIAYVPYYYKQYCNKDVIVRQLIEGIPLSDKETLKNVGVHSGKSFRMLVNALSDVFVQSGLINLQVGEDALLVRKFEPVQSQKNENNNRITFKSLFKSKQEIVVDYHIVLLKHDQYLKSQKLAKKFENWNSKVLKFKQKINLNLFYKNLGENQQNIWKDQLFLFAPLLKMYNKLPWNQK